ncbi:MAG TPA: DUF2148 domain-containing protein [Bacteroidales bacterium]|nr:DUF2148 domain-containing protein [Bacteroidales bacterium]
MITENEISRKAVRRIAEKMIVAARTAPKARGVDNLILAIAEKEDILEIAEKMKEIGQRINAPFFLRDAENILQASCLFLAAAKINTMGLPVCGLCGFDNCNEKMKQPAVPCVFNTGDLGIAIGSAVSVAANHRVDNRVMYTIGMAVKELGLLGSEAAIIYGIPLSATSKNPFFDRK